MSDVPVQKPRARDLGLDFPGETGRWNAITDVPGVTVGFTTLTDPARSIRTGVTAIRPRQDRDVPQPVRAGHFALNGNGEMTGTHWVDDAGHLIGPILITNTHGIGMAHHGAVRWMMRHYERYFREEFAWAMPIVAETYDGVLSDITALAVTDDHAVAAIDAAGSGPVAEGSVGGGNGMIAYEFKGGTGTSSRLVAIGGETFTVAALVQANHGTRPWLQILGVPVGRHLTDRRLKDREAGSIIVILATDAPLDPLTLRHLARRAAIGIGRGGTPGGDSSGDIFLAFSTADMGPMPDAAPALATATVFNQAHADPLYLAAVEAVEEAVVNAIVQGEDVPTVKPAGLVCAGIDTAALVDVMARHGRLKQG